MKTATRIVVMTVALSGLVSSSLSSASDRVIPSHLSAYSAGGPGPNIPIPTCGPNLPNCGNDGGGGIVKQ